MKTTDGVYAGTWLAWIVAMNSPFDKVPSSLVGGALFLTSFCVAVWFAKPEYRACSAATFAGYMLFSSTTCGLIWQWGSVPGWWLIILCAISVTFVGCERNWQWKNK